MRNKIDQNHLNKKEYQLNYEFRLKRKINIDWHIRGCYSDLPTVRAQNGCS